MSLEIFEKLDVGLSRFLRYSYAGVLFAILMSLFAKSDVENVRNTLGDAAFIFAIVVVGAGVFAVHRGLIIPIHHIFGIALHRGFEWTFIRKRKKAIDSGNPVVYLRARHNLTLMRAMLAYTHLRSVKGVFADPDALNLNHAMHGFIVMAGVSLIAAGLYEHFSGVQPVNWLLILVVGTVLVFLSWVPSMTQHFTECLELRSKEFAVETRLKRSGLIP